MKIHLDNRTIFSGTGAVFIAFLLFYSLSVLIHLDYFPLTGEEPRRAIVSIEMLESGNYILPTTMGWEYYNKPPFYNWMLCISMFLTGSTSELAVRLPTLVFILLWGICNYYIIKKIAPARLAALSSLFLVTSFDLYFWGLSIGGEIDVFYSFIVYLQVIAIYYFNLHRNLTALFIVSYLLCAIGFLTKGFPSLVFQVCTLLALCVQNRSVKILFSWQHLAGITSFLVIAGAYLLAYSTYSSPERLLTNLVKESVNKSAFGENSGKITDKILEYPLSFFKILLPWSLLLLLLFKKHAFRIWENPLVRFSLLFILFNIPVYWITGRPKMRYIYMFLPFCMIFLSYLYFQFRKENRVFMDNVLQYARILFVIALLILLAIPFYAKVSYWWLLFSALSILGYLYLYPKPGVNAIWWLGGGIMLIRALYALIFIPLKYENTPVKYDREMAAMASYTQNQPVSIYKKPDKLDLQIDLKISRLDFGSFPAIPYLAYQMPYYYYRSTGQIVKYDTLLEYNKNYIGFKSSLVDIDPEIIYSFTDRNQNGEEIVLFRMRHPSGRGIVNRFLKN
ncbi:MAG TPA: glycosyltransferase family 39 protein [Chitinophagaceae bacterium]|nr:glycosyltransferase family 39 protein [Chitinophagaceae bacterium]